MSRRAPIAKFLHRVLLVLLMLGACLQPALAAACDVEDLRDAAPAGHAMVVATADRHAGQAGDCCANPACGDCCLHATAFPPHVLRVVAPALHDTHPAPLAVEFRASDYPVDIRPPIAG